MANWQNNNFGNKPPYTSGRQNYAPRFSSEPPKPIIAEALPENYVDLAEAVIRKIGSPEEGIRKRGKPISTTKLRNLFSLIIDLYNVERIRSEQTILKSSVAGLQKAQIRVVYEAGREEAVKEFVTQAKILEYLKDIGNNREKLIAFAHYMEALVAYHRFYHVNEG